MMSHTSRVILLIDMDCFYCQVEENLNPDFKGKPLAVVQYNQWRGGGIIAVNYPARDKGVTRHMRGDDAKQMCPEIILAQVPQVRGKADLTKFRDAGKRVAEVLQRFAPHLERASVDEAYLDITEVVDKRIQNKKFDLTVDNLQNTFVVGNTTQDFVENVTRHKDYDESNFKLALGGVIAEEIRAEVYKVTGYRCSAGVAHNKILAKLVCGLHKPNKQTILPHQAVPQLYENMPVGKITGLGGKFGNVVTEKLGIKTMGQLIHFSQRELSQNFDEKSASWLYNIARGIDTEPVNTRLISQSIGCSKRFPGESSLRKKEDIEHWLSELAEEIFERLEKDLEENGRKAKQMVVNFAQMNDGEEVHRSKSHPLQSYDQKRIFENAFKIVQKNCLTDDGSYYVTFLGISTGNFQDVKKVREITSFFKNMRENAKKGTTMQKLDLRANHKKKLAADKIEGNMLDLKIQESKKNIKEDETSIFSQTTEESASDHEEDLIFYEQLHPESISNQNFDIMNPQESEIIEENSDVSHDSISGEICPQENQGNDDSAPVSSFFSRYFGTRNDIRNLITSVTVENGNLSDEKIEYNEDSNAGSCLSVKNSETFQKSNNYGDGGININKNINEMKVDCITCTQCGKTIDFIDYGSHMDYHFAISIVKNESHLYKSKNGPSGSNTPGNSGCKKRRKYLSNGLHKSIDAYFKTSLTKEERVEDKNVCSECNNDIYLSEWDVHMDYHAAKKLHLEMNGVQNKVSSSRDTVGSRTINQKKQKKDYVKSNFKGQTNMIGFLKLS